MTTGSLISLGGNLEHPRDSKPSDYPAVGPMGAAGMAEGAGKLVSQTEAQEGPRHTEDAGENTPSTWGVEDKGFVVQKNKGEGAGQSSLSYRSAVSLDSGQQVPNSAESY